MCLCNQHYLFSERSSAYHFLFDWCLIFKPKNPKSKPFLKDRPTKFVNNRLGFIHSVQEGAQWLSGRVLDSASLRCGP